MTVIKRSRSNSIVKECSFIGETQDINKIVNELFSNVRATHTYIVEDRKIRNTLLSSFY